MDIFDDIDQHIERAGAIERAATPIAYYVAWCANLQLTSAELNRTAERALIRLRFRDLTPREFFITNCHGRLTAAELNERGRQFTAAYYPRRYLDDYIQALGLDADDPAAIYSVEDDWHHYDLLAPVLTRRFFAAGRNPPPKPRRKSWLRVITGGKKD